MKIGFALAIGGSIIVAAACGLDSEGGFTEPTETNPATTGSGGVGNMGGASSVSTGASSSSGMGGSSSSSSSTSSTGGSTGIEDCLNGMDDDNDGMADCEDSDCGAFECVPAYQGATAYLSVVNNTSACPPASVGTDLRSCGNQCACTAAGGTCSQSVQWDRQQGCASPNGTLTSNGCLDPGWATETIRFSNAVATHDNNASCTPTSATIATQDRPACSVASAGTCANSAEVCVPTVQTKSASCVLLAGEVTCQSPYTTGATVYDDPSTTCNCSCGAGAPGCPSPQIQLWSSDGCPSGGQLFNIGTACTSFTNVDSGRLNSLTGSITCTADVAFAGVAQPQTLCCM